MTFWQRIAALPAWAVMGINVATWAILLGVPLTRSATLTWQFASLTVAPFSWTAFLFPLIPIWYFAVYRVATPTQKSLRFGEMIFLVGAIGYVVSCLASPALFLRVEDPPFGLIEITAISLASAGLGWVGGMWMAARAVNNADRKPDGGKYSTIGTFILMFYLPIGIWFLAGRLRRIVDAQMKAYR